jgi:hypothetical protein
MALAANGLWQRNSSGEEKGYHIFIWIVAFADGLETSRSVLIHHCESAMDTHHF